jgi:hypothetical protein
LDGKTVEDTLQTYHLSSILDAYLSPHHIPAGSMGKKTNRQDEKILPLERR